jgi:hypothetical protein
MHPAVAEPADSIQLTVSVPRTVYNALAEIWEREAGGVAALAADLLAQAVTFGSPADLYQDADATARELAALREQLEAVALLLADADVRPFLTQR